MYNNKVGNSTLFILNIILHYDIFPIKQANNKKNAQKNCKLSKKLLDIKKNDIYFPDRVWYEDLRTTPKLFLFAEKDENLTNFQLTFLKISKVFLCS